MKQPGHMTILVDRREQKPYRFQHVHKPVLSFEVRAATLRTGDYALADDAGGVDPGIVIERKAPGDFFASISHGRARFEREVIRMAEFQYRALVVECDWTGILNPTTNVSPAAAVATIVAWSQRYGVHSFLCPGRPFAEQLTFRLLERFRRDQLEGTRTEAAASA